MIFVELVGRDGQLLARCPVEGDAFPLTLRLEGDRVTALQAVSAKRPNVPPYVAPPSAVWAWLCSSTGTLMVSALTIVIFGLASYINTFADGGSDLIGVALLVFAVLLVWAGCWALGGRLAHNAAHFKVQLVWACLSAVALIVFSELAHLNAFLLPASMFAETVVTLLGAILIILILYGHITIASHMPTRRRWRIAIGTVVLLGGLMGLIGYESADKFSTAVRYSGSISPLDARYIPAESVTDFTKDIQALRQKVDKATKE